MLFVVHGFVMVVVRTLNTYSSGGDGVSGACGNGVLMPSRNSPCSSMNAADCCKVLGD